MPKQANSNFDTDNKHILHDTSGKSWISRKKTSTLSSLRIRNFRFLLAGTTISNAAQWIQLVTLNWLVYALTGSGIMLGTMNLARSLAAFGTIPAAGILIDRVERRRLLMIENGWLFAITLWLGLVLILGRAHIWHLFVFTFLAGTVQTFDTSLRQVVVFDLVPRSHTPNAVALIQTGWSLMRSLGPAAGGFFLLWLGPGGNFLIQAGAYALITITIIQIRFPARKSDGVRSSLLQSMKEGIRHIMKEPVTRAFMMLGVVLPLFIIPIFTILPPIYAVEVFGDESGRVLGLLMSFVGVGGVVGGVVTASLGRLERRGVLQLVSLFLLSLSLILFAFSTTLAVALLFLASAGFFEMIFLTTNQTLLQLSIPDNLRGRVTSVVNLNMVLMPLGGLVAGVGSDLLGGPKMITVVMAGIGALIAILVLVCSPTVRNHRLSQAIKSE